MTYVKTALLWLWLLSKRLYHRPAFVVMLVLIPALVLGYATINTEESGMVTIAVAQEGHSAPDETLLQDLKGDSQLLYYRTCSSPEEARTLVAAGKADTAWIFPQDLEKGIRAFVDAPEENPFIRVLVREDNVMLRLSRERLSGTTYTRVARHAFLVFVRHLAPELSHLSDADLMARYDRVPISENLFTFDESFAAATKTHYLLSPLRGLLGIVVMLCALAAAMYHLRDKQVGTFCRMSLRWRWSAELAGQLVAVCHLTAAAAVCLSLTGLSTGLGRELALTVGYSLCCAAFAMALRRLLGSLRGLAALLPALTVLALVVCPVFFDLADLGPVRLLLPPTYYIYGAHNPTYLWLMPVYAAACFGVYALAGALGRKENR
ncbi:MAG: ABC transporter permease [Ruminococcaceae bacterium]|nr:ABC transporter permease [Oscillospiraceae bacterium]